MTSRAATGARAAGLGLAIVLGVLAAGPRAATGERAGRDRIGAAPLARGAGWLAVVYELSLSTRTAGEPWAAAVDGALALSPRLTVGLAHSAGGLGAVDRSGGWCLASAAHTCPRRYRGGAIDLRWRVIDGGPRAGRLTALARAGLLGVSPWLPFARLGLRADAGRGRGWAVAQLELTMSLGGRELGNRDALEAPVWLGGDLRAGAGARVSGWLRTGARGELPELGGKLEIPIAFGVAIDGGRWRAGVDAGWPQLLGPQNAWKQRQAALWLALER